MTWRGVSIRPWVAAAHTAVAFRSWRAHSAARNLATAHALGLARRRAVGAWHTSLEYSVS